MHFTNLATKRSISFHQPPSARKDLRRFPPADWGRYVTIGIAAKSNDNECIVTVTDRRLSFDDAVPSVDSAVNKQWFIGKNWSALCAANDPCFILPIIEKANRLLRERGRKESAKDVESAMCDAYKAIRDEYIARQFLSKWGIRDIEEFRREDTGRGIYETIATQINNDTLFETTFLVCGYEDSADGVPRSIPRMFEIKSPGTPFLLDHLSYFAIGSGAAIAMASLNFKPLGHLNPAQLIYRVLEAKFSAESAVGRSTLVLIANRCEPTTFLSFGTIERIRKLWENSRMEPPPDEINKLIVETPPIPARI